MNLDNLLSQIAMNVTCFRRVSVPLSGLTALIWLPRPRLVYLYVIVFLHWLYSVSLLPVHPLAS